MNCHQTPFFFYASPPKDLDKDSFNFTLLQNLDFVCKAPIQPTIQMDCFFSLAGLPEAPTIEFENVTVCHSGFTTRSGDYLKPAKPFVASAS